MQLRELIYTQKDWMIILQPLKTKHLFILFRKQMTIKGLSQQMLMVKEQVKIISYQAGQ